MDRVGDKVGRGDTLRKGAAQPGEAILGGSTAVSAGLSQGGESRRRMENLEGDWGRQTSSHTLGTQQRGLLLLAGQPDN